MGSQSAQSVNLIGVRAVGSLDPATQKRFGGIYIPKHTDKNGKALSARWEGNVMLNSPGYTDANGQPQEGRKTTIRLVAWNGRDAKPGKGLADNMAKAISVGKEFSILDGKLESFDKRIFVNNVPLIDPATGNARTYQALNVRITGDVVYGNDSALSLSREIDAYAPLGGTANFHSRPKFWNVPGHADEAAWKTVIAFRSAQTWDGGGEYGYARIVIPEGATTEVLPKVAGAVPGVGPVAAAAALQNMQAMQNMMAMMAANPAFAALVNGGVAPQTQAADVPF